MDSPDHLGAGLDQLRRGRTDRAVRELERALDGNPHCADTREFVLEAHRCRNPIYWCLAGYWRWQAPSSARWFKLAIAATLMALAAAAQFFGGFAVLDGLPTLYEPNALARVVQMCALAGLGLLIAAHEGKVAWVVERAATVVLVPREVREACLDTRQRTEHARAVAYAVLVPLLFLQVLVAWAVSSTWTMRLDGFWLASLSLTPAATIVALLPRPGLRAVFLALLGLACCAALGEALLATPAHVDVNQLGRLSLSAFLCGLIVLPIALLLHRRGVKSERERATLSEASVSS